MIRGGAVVINVTDVSRAVRFYIETLGMKLVEETGAASVIDAGDGFRIELRSGESPGAAPGPVVRLYAKVPIEEAIAIYENRGVAFTTEQDAGKIVSARFRDPDANQLVLVPGDTTP
jgi:catechol 2,3-dioxygenase-like lactoylglutathione lyase family enzyme